jgi:hypothetical protein
LAGLSVDLGPIGAFQIGKYQMLVIKEDFAVVATDAFIVKLDGVPFFASDRDRGSQIAEDFPTVSPLHDAKGQF